MIVVTLEAGNHSHMPCVSSYTRIKVKEEGCSCSRWASILMFHAAWSLCAELLLTTCAITAEIQSSPLTRHVPIVVVHSIGSCVPRAL